MRAINQWLWAVGLVLQCLLLGVLLVRGVARRFPFFALLIAFYAARSALLFALFGHVAPATYRMLYSELSLADIVLQLIVAGELAFHAVQEHGWNWRRAAVFPALLAVAGAVVWSFAAALPARAPVPLDRGAVFTSSLLLLLFLWMSWMKTSRLPRFIVIGFAFYSAVGLVAVVERTRAASMRHVSTYSAWSYVQAGVYLGVLLFWLLALRNDREELDAMVLPASPTAT